MDVTNLSGQYLGRYYLAERLGEGGMAIVYKAYDTRLERDVAIKIIRTGAFPADSLDEVLKRFEREAKSLAKLSHPNIVKVHDYGEHEGSPYIVMEYMPGGTLKKVLGKPMPWQAALRLLLPVARGVAYAHQHGIVHRDIKPANILITENGDPMLSDFGIAKLFETDQSTHLTGTGMLVGTPEYMAPEQWDGKSGPQSDLYSMGIVLYEMVAGRKPYVADTPMSILVKQATEPLPPPRQFVADLPEGIEHLLIKALARDPRERFADFNALIQSMEALLMSAPTVLPQRALDAISDGTLVEPAATLPPKSTGNAIPAPTGQTGSTRSGLQSRRSPFGQFAIFGGIGFVALLGVVVLVAIGLFGVLPRLLKPAPTATFSQVPPTPSAVSIPTKTPAPQFGFTLVEPQNVLKLIPNLKNLTDLAVEKYSNESWNKVDGKLIFTIHSKPDVSVVWDWGWCAVNDQILAENMTKINVVFSVDGYVLPESRLAKNTYKSSDSSLENWKCQSISTVLQDWKPGTYKLIQTIDFSSPINDGKDTFDAGHMVREYTVTISK